MVPFAEKQPDCCGSKSLHGLVLMDERSKFLSAEVDTGQLKEPVVGVPLCLDHYIQHSGAGHLVSQFSKPPKDEKPIWAGQVCGFTSIGKAAPFTRPSPGGKVPVEPSDVADGAIVEQEAQPAAAEPQPPKRRGRPARG